MTSDVATRMMHVMVMLVARSARILILNKATRFFDSSTQYQEALPRIGEMLPFANAVS